MPPAAGSQAETHFPEMIIAAIKAHNKIKKSRLRVNRRKISKYITSTFKNLPTNHRRMLTYHLDKMTDEGFLKIDRKCYVLPTTSPGPKQKSDPKSKPKTTSRRADCTPKTVLSDEILMSDEPWPNQFKPVTPTKSNDSGGQAPTTKRGRGRPARVKTDVGHVAAEDTKRHRSLSGKPLGWPNKVGSSSNMDTLPQPQPPPITQRCLSTSNYSELIDTRGERGGDRETSYQGVLEESHL